MTGHSLIVSAIIAAHPTDGADRMHRAKNIPHPCLYRTDGGAGREELVLF
jgi:hypothetical protein